MARSAIRVVGLTQVLRNLNAHLDAVMFVTLEGLVAGGLLIQRDSQKLCPVDLGNLKASHFTIWTGRGGPPPAPKFEGEDSGRLSTDHYQVVAMEMSKLPGGLRGIVRPQVEVGVSAYYGIFVHEDIKARHTVGGAKFLERSVVRNTAKVLSFVKIGVAKTLALPKPKKPRRVI
jgi:hypothetical protein